MFRRVFELPAVARDATLRMYAESIYHAWVNGKYVGRGPIFHHPTRHPFDTYDIAALLRPGRNAIAVLVHAPGIALHNSVPAGEPGLVADLRCACADGSVIRFEADGEWRATDQTGWRSDVPKRNWAIGFTECFDAGIAPANWQAVEFDDTAWQKATEVRPATSVAGAKYVAREIPQLRYAFREPGVLMGAFGIAAMPGNLAEKGFHLAKSIMESSWLAPDRGLVIGREGRSTIRVSGLRQDRGAILCFDMGEEVAGNIILECRCGTSGTIDVGWSEVAENGRPLLMRKGVSYVDRILARPGQVAWEQMNFTGLRYLALVVRGFEGEVTVNRLGVRTSEPDVRWIGRFHSNDERLNQIWAMCQRTLRVGTQEGQMDCPSREQSPYVGDGVLTARWFAQLTGDVRHWKYIIREQFRRQSPGGLVRPSIFTGSSDTLCDYSLLAVVGTRDYWRFTGDRETVCAVLPACRRALAWFTSQFDDRGLYVSNWEPTRNAREWENRYDPKWPDFVTKEQVNLFIDHPGMGWHNVDEAGIDRRGTNAAINALIVLTQRALADLEDAAGKGDRAVSLRAQADALAATIGREFFDQKRNAFADGIHEGRLLDQISEQTNTWAIAAGACDDRTGSAILQKLLTSHDPAIARNGPYFWAYLFPLLDRLGLNGLAMERARTLWGRMIDGGATTLWETFKGDDKDTWCHPWSGAAVEFCLAGLLGLPTLNCAAGKIVLGPRYDLMEKAEGACVTPAGYMSISWKRSGAAVELSGELPDGVVATIQDPSGRAMAKVSGRWQQRIALRG